MSARGPSQTSGDVREGPISAEIRCLRHVRLASNNGLMSDVAATRFRAQEGTNGTAANSISLPAAESAHSLYGVITLRCRTQAFLRCRASRFLGQSSAPLEIHSRPGS